LARAAGSSHHEPSSVRRVSNGRLRPDRRWSRPDPDPSRGPRRGRRTRQAVRARPTPTSAKQWSTTTMTCRSRAGTA